MLTRDAETNSRQPSIRQKLEYLAFNILTGLDGQCTGIPGFVVAPYPHVSDRQDAEQHGENWWPYNDRKGVKADIGGKLHAQFHGALRKYDRKQ